RKLGLVFLDACRDNPLAERLARGMGTRSNRVGVGLGRVEDVPSRTLVAFATASNTVAFDGEGSNSPYTTALLKNLREPNLELQLMLRRVRAAVLEATNGSQEPREDAALGPEPFFFNPQVPNRPPQIADQSPL